MNNQGRVILEDMVMKAPPFSNAGGYGLEVEGCRQVAVNASTAQGEPAVLCTNSTLNLSSCRLQGQNAWEGHQGYYSWHSDYALRASGSRVTVGWCELRGGSGTTTMFGLLEASPAVRLDTCATRITGDAGAVCIGGTPPPGGQPVSGIEVVAGSLVIDPTVTVLPGGSAPPISSTGAVTIRRLPALESAGAAPGSTLTANVFAEAGSFIVLAAGSPTNSRQTILGGLWLDPGNQVMTVLGNVGTTEYFTHRVTVPGLQSLLGRAFTLQAAALPSSGGGELTNPVVVVLH